MHPHTMSLVARSRRSQMVLPMFLCLAVGAAACAQPAEQAEEAIEATSSVVEINMFANPLRGVWRTTGITRTGPNAVTIALAQPGLVFFTDGYYSIMRVNSDSPRPDLAQADLSTASADTLRAVYGPITGQAGTYEADDETVTFRPQVAKNTFVMAPGTFFTYRYTLDGDSLTMTSVTARGELVDNPTTYTYSRVE